jgi:hypothetical protein
MTNFPFLSFLVLASSGLTHTTETFLAAFFPASKAFCQFSFISLYKRYRSGRFFERLSRTLLFRLGRQERSVSRIPANRAHFFFVGLEKHPSFSYSFPDIWGTSDSGRNKWIFLQRTGGTHIHEHLKDKYSDERVPPSHSYDPIRSRV